MSEPPTRCMNKKKTYVRRVTLADKDEVLRIRDDVDDGLDILPSYYDYFLTSPNVYAVGAFRDEKMVGFLLVQLVDAGLTGVLRKVRVKPEYTGLGIIDAMCRHITLATDWPAKKTIKWLLSTERELDPLVQKKFRRFEKITMTWIYVSVELKPQDFESFHASDIMLASHLEFVNDSKLSALFQDSDVRDYIAPRGFFNVFMIPMTPHVVNIPTIRGLDDSTVIYSDLHLGKREYSGLLSCRTRFTPPDAATVDDVFYLDILGDDRSSIRKHVVRHLTEMPKIADDKYKLFIFLRDGLEFDEVSCIFKEYNVEIDEHSFSASSCARTHLIEWWKRGENKL